jgi:hypothetical protein
LNLEGRDITTLSVNKEVVGRSDTRVKLSLVEVAEVGESERDRLLQRQSALKAEGEPVSLVNPQPGEEARHRAELGNKTIEQLLAELAEVRPEGETNLYLKVRALVWLEPDKATRLADVLRDARANSPAVRILTQALALSGRPAAQAALADVARARKDDWAIMAEILPALGETRQPTEVIDRVLNEIARKGRDWNTCSTAQLALGALARTLMEQAPARAAAIVRWASAELASARTTQHKRQFLLVLGNTASPASLPVIKQYLEDTDPGVRGAAVLALRWHRGEAVERILCRALTDPDDTVRQEAAGAFEVRSPTRQAVEALVQALKRDRSVSVRLAVLARLIALQKKYPQAKEAIRRAAKDDPAAEVREAARER